MKHLRIRESSELGATRFHGICGVSGLAARDFPKSATQVDCDNCKFILSPAWKKRNHKTKGAKNIK